MEDGFSWQRLRLAVRDVALPWEGLKRRWEQVVAWAAVLGAPVVAVVGWQDVMPPSLRGKLLLAVLVLLLLGLGVHAAYQLRLRLDELGGSARAERDAQRQKAVASGVRLIYAVGAYGRIASKKTEAERKDHAKLALVNAFEKYDEACAGLPFADAVLHSPIQADFEHALKTYRSLGLLASLSRPIQMLSGYVLKILRNTEGLDEDEAQVLIDYMMDMADPT